MVGPMVVIAPLDLRNLALVLVSLLRYLDGTWTMDLLREKRLRRALDELANLHGLPCLGQLPPGFLTVRVYAADEEPTRCNLEAIRRDVAAKRAGQDIIFDLRIIVISVISRDGPRATAYLIPWDRMQKFGPQLSNTRAELEPYAVATPADVNASEIAHDMKLLS